MRPSARLLAASVSILGALVTACGGSPSKPDGNPDGNPDGKTDASQGDASADTKAPDAPTPSDAAHPSDLGVGDAASAADAASDAPAEAAPPASGSPFRALGVAMGGVHTCALLDNHRVKCSGNNGYGQLGYGDRTYRGGSAADMGDALPFVDVGTGRTVTTIAAGRYHTCALLDDGSVKCWGLGGYQGVEPGPTFNSIGDEPGEMGDGLRAVNLGAGRRAVQLASGYGSSCAVLDDGTARCWGVEPPILPTAVPLVGSNEKVRQLTPLAHGVLALFEDGKVSDVLPSGAYAGTPQAPADEVSYIAGSRLGLCFVLKGGIAQCRPMNGKTLTAANLVAMGVNEAATFACGILTNGDVRCWGSAGTACERSIPGATYWCNGPRGPDGDFQVALGQRAVAIATGAFDAMCAVLSDGGVKCWSVADTCTFDNGTFIRCDVPETGKQDANLGSSIEITTVGGKPSYGAWRAVDLGKHP